MKNVFDLRSFRSRVARRLFAVFVACALAPVTAFAVFSFVQVSAQLERDARARLRDDSKGAGMAVLERLLLLELGLRVADADTAAADGLDGRFRRIFSVHAPGPGRPAALPADLAGREGEILPAGAAERAHLAAGNTLLRVLPEPDGTARLLLVQAPHGDPRRLRVGELEPAHLWRPDGLRAGVELTVRDGAGRLLFASHEEAAATAGAAVELGGQRFLREEWSLFLDSLYRAPAWRVAHFQPESLVFEPLREFRTVFPLVALLSLWIVLLLSAGQIRRRLVPIELLRDATRRVTARDFAARVDVRTDDEFRELGEAFNEMTAHLGDLTQNLERKVVERTRQLQETLDELRATQSQLVHQEKMASLGRFVAGIAHELNNPLAFIEGNLHFLESHARVLVGALADYERAAAEPAADLPGRLEAIRAERGVDHVLADLRSVIEGCAEGVGRTVSLVSDLRSFSRVDDAERLPVDLNEAMDSTLNVLRNRLERVEVVKEYTKLPPVECLAGQMNQVLMNLVANAADAVEGAGRIVVRSRDLRDGRVALEVEDDGCGIEPDTLERIFDPFYTTKPVGEGTGLGLAISYGVVQRHGGSIRVESTPGRGSCFRVELPVAWRGSEAPDLTFKSPGEMGDD